MNLTEEAKAENYFIQFIFVKNRDLLRVDYRTLYDALFKKYKSVYQEGKEKKVDLMDINKKFLLTL